MKTIRKTTLLVIAIFSFAIVKANNPIKDENVKVNTEKSKINWLGEKVTGEHRGTIDLKDGNLKIKDGILIGGNFNIDMTTITNTDLDGEYKGKLEGHLKSDDFFGVSTYPTASLTITKVLKNGDAGKYNITADITIKGITKSIKFEAQMVDAKGSYTVVATIVIDRSKFDVRYGSGSFFDDLGDKTIYDEFTLTVNLVTK